MQFNVAQLLKKNTGEVRTYELVEDLSSLDRELVILGPLVGTLKLMRTHSGILATGEFSTALEISCNYCLDPFVLPIRFSLEENFRPLMEVNTGRHIAPDEYEGTEAELEDDALLINMHHILDISEVIRQNLWLALPMYPTCRWSNLDHCPNGHEIGRSGVVYTTESEETGVKGTSDTDSIQFISDEQEEIDPRWQVLLTLQKNK